MKIQEIKIRTEQIDNLVFYHVSFIQEGDEKKEHMALTTPNKNDVMKEVFNLLSYT